MDKVQNWVAAMLSTTTLSSYMGIGLQFGGRISIPHRGGSGWGWDWGWGRGWGWGWGRRDCTDTSITVAPCDTGSSKVPDKGVNIAIK